MQLVAGEGAVVLARAPSLRAAEVAVVYQVRPVAEFGGPAAVGPQSRAFSIHTSVHTIIHTHVSQISHDVSGLQQP